MLPFHVGEIIQVTELSYANHSEVFGNTEETLQENVDELIKQLKYLNMECNTEKMKTMILVNEIAKHNVKIEGQDIERVKKFSTWEEL